MPTHGKSAYIKAGSQYMTLDLALCWIVRMLTLVATQHNARIDVVY